MGLDVFDQEAHVATSLRAGTKSADPEVLAAIAISERDDCLCTPHNAFNTVEAVERKSADSAQQIIAFLKDGAFLWSPPTPNG